MHRSLPPNCLFNAQLQIFLLNSQQHDSNVATREFIGSLLNKLSTLLALLVHSCKTDLSIEHDSWPTKLSLSKRTNGADSPSLVKYSSLKILSTSASRSTGSSFSSGNLNPTSRLNWSYLVNTAITGTRKILDVYLKFIQSRLDVPFLSGHILSTCFRSSDGRALSIGTQYLNQKKPFRIFNHKYQKGQTILRAVYSPISFPATYDEQTLEQSLARFHHLLRILASREKHNLGGL
jgi:hypothetical protein